jgi:mRNA interferase HicA
MKRNRLIKHLINNGCIWEREGSNHTIYFNPNINKLSAVPRHKEIGDVFCNVRLVAFVMRQE